VVLSHSRCTWSSRAARLRREQVAAKRTVASAINSKPRAMPRKREYTVAEYSSISRASRNACRFLSVSAHAVDELLDRAHRQHA
jgi:hypothetical protein